MSHATTLSDKELRRLGNIRRADHAASYDFHQHGWSSEYMVTFMAREMLELRCLLRRARGFAPPGVHQRIDEYLGMHADGENTLPDWEPETEKRSTGR